MGISRSATKCLIELGKEHPFDGKSVLQLGRQCVYLSYDDLLKMAREWGITLKEDVPIHLSWVKALRKKRYIDDITFFKLLGFKEVYSTDVSDYEGPTFLHDLNTPIDNEYEGRFDLIFDGGTVEHVFHFPQSLANIHKMLKKKGMIIHASPSHNHVDHGFYMFSPTVFFEYYAANDYDIVRSWVIKYAPKVNKPWKIYDYRPGHLASLSYGGFGKEMLAIWLVACKQANSTFGRIPQQSWYHEAWSAPRSSEIQSVKKMSVMKKTLKQIFLLNLYHKLRKRYKLGKKHRRRSLEDHFICKY